MGRLLESVGDPLPDSPLAFDDAQYPWEKLTAWVRSYLVAGLDHLMLWSDLTVPLRFHPRIEIVHQMRPPFTLARAAMEAGAQAAWILGPIESRNRVFNHLRLVDADLLEQLNVLEESSSTSDAVRERRDALRGRLDAMGISADDFGGRPPGYRTLIREGARYAEIDSDAAEMAWREASAAAHGKNWFSVVGYTVRPGEEYEPGYYRASYVPRLESITETVAMARSLLLHAVLRYARGLGHDLTELLDAAGKQVLADPPRPIE